MYPINAAAVIIEERMHMTGNVSETFRKCFGNVSETEFTGNCRKLPEINLRQKYFYLEKSFSLRSEKKGYHIEYNGIKKDHYYTYNYSTSFRPAARAAGTGACF